MDVDRRVHQFFASYGNFMIRLALHPRSSVRRSPAGLGLASASALSLAFACACPQVPDSSFHANEMVDARLVEDISAGGCATMCDFVFRDRGSGPLVRCQVLDSDSTTVECTFFADRSSSPEDPPVTLIGSVADVAVDERVREYLLGDMGFDVGCGVCRSTVEYGNWIEAGFHSHEVDVDCRATGVVGDTVGTAQVTVACEYRAHCDS